MTRETRQDPSPVAPSPIEPRPTAGDLARVDPASWSAGERIFAGAVFPVVMGTTLLGCVALIDAGWSPLLAFAACQIPAFAAVIVCERLVPYDPDWNRSKGDIGVDAAHTLTVAVGTGLLQPVISVVGLAIATWLSVRVGLGLWPTTWPLLAQLALALIVVEFFQYWVHRLQHERPWLWRFHATHHSAPRLYWLNAGRFHVVDILMNNFFGHIPLVAMGAAPEVLVLWTLFSAVHGIFQHANTKLRLGPLNWIFSMAELHRWHHSRLVDESNTNYGQALILWDVVFGTRYLPKDRFPPLDIGLTGLDGFPMTYFAQLASPFRWQEIERRSASGRPPVSETGRAQPVSP